jgi:hypothetical protein
LEHGNNVSPDRLFSYRRNEIAPDSLLSLAIGQPTQLALAETTFLKLGRERGEKWKCDGMPVK